MHDTAPNSDQEDAGDDENNSSVPNSPPAQPLLLNEISGTDDGHEEEPMEELIDESTHLQVLSTPSERSKSDILPFVLTF